ncbi:MAG: hypothetical protein J7D96_22675 [Escherichia coli]|nr:hypothetical protein [Escherichia coli]
MNNKRATKRALLTSIMALVMCVVMLVGTTFAWFTDTASTGVNKIVSGNLKVDIIGADSDSHIEKLNFTKAAGAEGEALLWEPGCRYLTQGFRIANKGNLALKWKAEINKDNIVDSKAAPTAKDGKSLLDVIDFYVVTGTGENAPEVAIEDFVGNLAKDAKSDVYYIKGVMQTTAGNDYQNLTLDGITITVYATQLTAEFDSFDNQYDKDAKYTEVIAAGKTFTGKATLSTGITATNPGAIAVKAIGADADVTILDGTFDGGKGGNNICVAAANGAKVTIKGGTFTVGGDADGYGNSVIYSQGGNITIEGGFFQTDYNWKGFYYVLNQQNGNPGTITVKGGTFVNYDPSKGDDNLDGNFVAEGYAVISETKANGDVWYTVVSKSNSEGLKTVLANGGELTVSEKIETNNSGDNAADRVIISKPTTLNLNAKIVFPDNMGNNNTNFCALIVDADTTINAGESGGIDTGTNGGYGINVRNGATLTINGGSYYGGGTAVQVQKGTLIINGGHFACEPYSNPVYGYKYLINCIDAAYKDGSAKIIIKGGTFVNFDPSNNSAEGTGTNFVADGYKVVSEAQTNGDVWYTVVSK